MGDMADFALEEMMNQDEIEQRYQTFDEAADAGVEELLYDYNGARFPGVFDGCFNMARRKRTKVTPSTCPYCGTVAVCIDSKEIYGRSYGLAWKCPTCPDVYVGCHKGTRQPLGRLADAELRNAKIAAHAAFDPLWKRGTMTRSEAYWWLAKALNLAEPPHIGEMNLDQCRRVVEVCRMASQTERKTT